MRALGCRPLAAVATLLLLLLLAPSPAAALSAAEVRDARDAFAAIDRERWSEAAALGRRITDPLTRKLITWHRITGGDESLTFAEIAAFLDANPDWPWPITMHRRAEAAIDATVPPARLVAWFAAHSPQSADGGMWQARALRAVGDDAAARAAAQAAWVEGSFDAATEAEFLATLGDYLSADDHRRRLDTLAWEGRQAEARRMLPRVDPATRALAEARLALRARRPGVDAAIRRVPESLRDDPGLVYERVRWRRKSDLDQSARDLLHAHRPDAAAPGRFWTERAILARRALAEDRFREAYRTASRHANTDDADYAEAEFLAGWIALRFLNEPQRAFEHFQAMYQRVSFPISLARGAYWMARAAEAQGRDADAARWYRAAADHPTTFYGQLAATTLAPGRRPPLPFSPVASEAERVAFQAHELARAAALLRTLGENDRLPPFLLRLADISEAPGWKALAAQLAHDVGRPDMGVFVGKQAYRTGHHLIDLAYPTAPLPAGGAGAEPPLIYGLIRQESAFRTDAVSRAGARGLMQLMPATARGTAQRAGVPYARTRLLTDPAYNIRLGSAYLRRMLDRFGGSYILALAAYNAGPSRAARWRNANGDPAASVEAAIDWIEAIPFSETRNYVQRVLENVQVYRTKLDGPGPGTTLDQDLLR